MSKPKYTAADLVAGRIYRVIAAFQDYDGETHAVGETWRYVTKSFSPYEDGLTLFLEQEGREVRVRLQWRPEAQATVIDAFSDHVEEVTGVD